MEELRNMIRNNNFPDDVKVLITSNGMSEETLSCLIHALSVEKVILVFEEYGILEILLKYIAINRSNTAKPENLQNSDDQFKKEAYKNAEKEKESNEKNEMETWKKAAIGVGAAVGGLGAVAAAGPVLAGKLTLHQAVDHI